MKPKSGHDQLLDAAPNPDAETASRQGGRDDTERRERISVAAYYNAERRGFQPGSEVDDWLDAEKLIDGRVAEKGERGEAATRQPGVAEEQKAAAGGRDRPDFPDLSAAGIEHIEPDKVAQWAKRLNVPAPRLREAIKRVGPVVDDVRKFLESRPG